MSRLTDHRWAEEAPAVSSKNCLRERYIVGSGAKSVTASHLAVLARNC